VSLTGGKGKNLYPAPHLKENKNGKYQICRDLRKNIIVGVGTVLAWRNVRTEPIG